MLDFIYYPVSFILWCWHWVFGHVFGEASAVAWVLGIMFLVFTLRALMFRLFVKQVRSMRQMQEFAPEIKKIQKKYANDRQKQAQEMQKLQREHGFSPLGGCLPMLLQIPVFIGLFHVLRSFAPNKTENYFFDQHGVDSYVAANLFGARLSNWITQPTEELTRLGATRPAVVMVTIPLAVLAGVLTHLTSRHSVARQNPATATAQTAIMNKVVLYLFPVGIVVSAVIFPFPIGLVVYWLANNAWTLMQQSIVYRKIDREEAAKKAAAVEKRASLGPKPGQKPRPGQKPVQGKKRPPASAKPAESSAESSETPATEATDGSAKSDAASDAPSSSNGSASTEKSTPAKKPASAKPSADGTEIPGLISDRSRSKKSGRRNR